MADLGRSSDPPAPHGAGEGRAALLWQRARELWVFRAFAVWAHDLVAAVAAWFLAYGLRYNFEGMSEVVSGMLPLLAWSLPVQALVFWLAGLYRGLWRYASLPDLRRIVIAAVVASAAVPIVGLMMRIDTVIPRSTLVIMPLAMILLMAGSRFGYRMLREYIDGRAVRDEAERVIIVGALDACVALLREISRGARMKAVAILDEDRARHGRVMHGVPVLGAAADYPRIARTLGVKTAIVALRAQDHEQRRRVVQICASAGAKVLTIPSLEELMSGGFGIDRLRRIEVEDLLGRDAVRLDGEQLRLCLTARRIMVTGAGGSIGSELCRQIAQFHPSLLVLFEASEFALYKLQEEFATRFPGVPIVALVGDVKNVQRVDSALASCQPDVIFHAAAYKHVPMMEERNAWEAVRNNTFGTWVVADSAIRHGVDEFVLISTDKAVNPTNVMGASKRMAEMVCQALQARGGTRVEIVRFGNVLGSNGSVIPKFAEQIAKGGPLTVTHPDIIRYFMSIPEAAQLVLQAAAMGKGGEIFVLDMGEPVRIVDLARDMIRLSGFTEAEIGIEFTGLRAGEKLYEELLADGESTRETHHEKVKVAKAREVSADWLDEFLPWLAREDDRSDDEVRRDLRRWVPEYASPTRPELRRVVG